MRSNILSTEPLPSLNRIYSLVSTEETHCSIDRSRDVGPEAAAFLAKTAVMQRSSSASHAAEGERPTCDYCNRRGHLRKSCFKLRKDTQRQAAANWEYQQQQQGSGFRRQPLEKKKSIGRVVEPLQAHAVQSPGSNFQAQSSAQAQLAAFSFSDAQIRRLLEIAGPPGPSDARSDPLTGNSYNLVSCESDWIIDSGASRHITGFAHFLINYSPIKGKSNVYIPDGSSATATHIGEVNLGGIFHLKNVLYIPNFKCNLISVSQLCKELNCDVLFSSNLCVIQDRTSRRMIGQGELQGGVYQLQRVLSNSTNRAAAVRPCDLWHRRLGHPSYRLQINGIETGGVMNKDCPVCHRAKQTRSQFSISMNKAQVPFQLIHCDLWGPYKIRSHSGAYYFLTIVDDFSRAIWIYPLRTKSDAAKHLMRFCALIRTQFDKTIQVVRSDNGPEFLSKEIQDFFSTNGIIHQTSCVDTPQQNGRVERKHRHLLNVARALLFQSSLPTRFWEECVCTAAYLINLTPTSLLSGRSPFDVLFGQPPSYLRLKVFGCLCYAQDRPLIKDKFAERARKCVFIGYPYGKKGWRVFDIETRRIFVSRDVHFYEDIFPFASVTDSEQQTLPTFLDSGGVSDATPLGLNGLGQASPSSPSVSSPASPAPLSCSPAETSPSSSTSTLPITSGSSAQAPAPRQSSRSHVPPRYLDDYVCNTALDPPSSSACSPAQSPISGTVHSIHNHLSYTTASARHLSFLAALDSDTEPTSYKQALSHPLWREAMTEEIRALELNGTWTVEPLPAGKKAIGCKWVFKIKRRADGTINRYKARLVAKGFTQVEGIDFHETFAPVAKLVTVRCLLTVAVARGWEIYQMDVQNAFLHGDLHEEVYMRLPPGYSSTSSPVCRLRKSLYGLRQASRNWFHKLAATLLRYGFIKSEADHSLFTYSNGDIFTAVLIYVDDLLIVGNNTAYCASFKAYLHDCFRIKDLGSLRYFLGIEVSHLESGLFLNQRKYTIDILTECGMLGSRPTFFPMEQRHGLSGDSGSLFSDPGRYRRLVGRLIYLTITRPELSYSIHILSQFLHSPRQPHWEAALRVVRYLKQSPGQGILLRPTSLDISAYCDSDWASCPMTRRSTTGYFITIGGSPVSWKTKKQTTVSRSSAEAEYRAMAATVSELIWLRSLLRSLGVVVSRSIPLHCDNKAALHIAANPVFHERTKHIEIDCHFIRDHIQSQLIAPVHLPTHLQLADIFTKALGRDRFRFLLCKLGIRDPHSHTPT